MFGGEKWVEIRKNTHEKLLLKLSAISAKENE
jgi:hypothetical protein